MSLLIAASIMLGVVADSFRLFVLPVGNATNTIEIVEGVEYASFPSNMKSPTWFKSLVAGTGALFKGDISSKYSRFAFSVRAKGAGDIMFGFGSPQKDKKGEVQAQLSVEYKGVLIDGIEAINESFLATSKKVRWEKRLSVNDGEIVKVSFSARQHSDGIKTEDVVPKASAETISNVDPSVVAYKSPTPYKWRMSIVSVSFIFFCLVAAIIYLISPPLAQPWILLSLSAAFYSFFNCWAFLFIGISVVSIWLGGLWLTNKPSRVAVGVVVLCNIGLLALTKYVTPVSSIVVPLGISFYSLQAISYIVDVYRKTIPAERHLGKLALYLIFFPTIMQGPISRFGQLAPQLWAPHKFDYERMHSGLALALWGFFKKMVIADRAAMLVDTVFAPGSSVEGFATILGVFCYSVQIYADFSGCVDICRGISEIIGIDLIQNFKHPYFATSIKDFWRRWHISLSSWLKDYVYIPLGGNRHGEVRKYLNILLVFGVSGIWHGTGVNYFIWGLLHGFYQVFDGLTSMIREKILNCCKVDQTTFSFRFGQRIGTFVLVSFAWIFFRAQSFTDACSVIKRMFVWNPWTWTDGSYLTHGLDAKDFDVLFVSLMVLIAVSILQEKGSVRLMLRRQTLWFRWMIYLIGFFATIIFGVYGPGCNESGFIYMQF